MARTDKDGNSAPNGDGGEDWKRWSEWVKDGVRELRKEIKEIGDEVDRLRIEMATQKVKVGVIGMIGSAIPIIITLLIMYIKSQVNK